MIDLYVLVAGAMAILIGVVLITYAMARRDGYVKAYDDVNIGVRADYRAVGKMIERLAEAVLGLDEKLTGVRQETERAVDHLRHKYDEEIVYAETERNRIIDAFAREERALREKLEIAGVPVIGNPVSAKYEKRAVPEKRPLGASIGGPSDQTHSRGGSLTGKGLAEVFVEEAKKPGADQKDAQGESSCTCRSEVSEASKRRKS
jgi:hypothetical protein